MVSKKHLLFCILSQKTQPQPGIKQKTQPQPNPNPNTPRNEVYVMNSSKMITTQPFGATGPVTFSEGPITPAAPRAMESLTTIYTLVTKDGVKPKGWKRNLWYWYVHIIYIDIITDVLCIFV